MTIRDCWREWLDVYKMAPGKLLAQQLSRTSQFRVCITLAFLPKMTSITKPLDLIKLSIGERVYIKCRGGRELEGLLHAFDSHMNMVLEDVEETVTTTDIDEETEEELVQSRKRNIEMLFVRGDVVILVSPPLRVA